MVLNRRRILSALALLLAAGLLGEGYAWFAAERINRAVRGADPAQLAASDPAASHPFLTFARAHEAAARGDYAAALAAYKAVSASGPDSLQEAALFNLGNLHLREALRRRDDSGLPRPLVELAKASYRAVLRRNPEHWDARYNLERALRLAPESPEEQVEALPPPPAQERAVTTMQGFSVGLP